MGHRESMGRWWNELPGWLLPLLGVIPIFIGVQVHVVVFDVGGSLVVAFGLLGWNAKRCAALLPRTYGG
jgi:hypothetical protein